MAVVGREYFSLLSRVQNHGDKGVFLLFQGITVYPRIANSFAW